jgi:hypothetical protein
MYTADELIAHAHKQRIKVSTRQIREWTKDGLLPEPTRAALPGQGKAGIPYRYPEPAPPAVVWLGEHRRRIDGVDRTKFWMRVEGLSYVQVDLNQVVRDACIQAWKNLEEKGLPLPPLDEAVYFISSPAYEGWREKALIDYGNNIATPALNQGVLTEENIEWSTIVAAMVGLYRGNEEALSIVEDAGGAGMLPGERENKRYADVLFGIDNQNRPTPPPPHEDYLLKWFFESMNIIDTYIAANGGAHVAPPESDDIMPTPMHINWLSVRMTWKLVKNFFPATAYSLISDIKYDVLHLVGFSQHLWWLDTMMIGSPRILQERILQERNLLLDWFVKMPEQPRLV